MEFRSGANAKLEYFDCIKRSHRFQGHYPSKEKLAFKLRFLGRKSEFIWRFFYDDIAVGTSATFREK